MKFQKIICVPGVLLALGAALLLASSARAQQEVEPTTFEIVPGEPANEQPAAGRAVHGSDAAKEAKAVAAPQAATQGRKEPATEATIWQVTASDIAGLLVLTTGMGVVVLCAIAGRWPKRYRNRFTEKRSAGREGERRVEYQALDAVVKQWSERVGPPA